MSAQVLINKFLLTVFHILPCNEMFVVTLFLPLLLECSVEIIIINNETQACKVFGSKIDLWPLRVKGCIQFMQIIVSRVKSVTCNYHAFTDPFDYKLNC